MGCCRSRYRGPVKLQFVELVPGILQEHRTDEFADSAKNDRVFLNSSFVFRRGAIVRLKVTSADGETPYRLCARLHDAWDVTATVLDFPASTSGNIEENSTCFTQPAGAGSAMVHFRLPHAMPIGEYSLTIAPEGHPGFGVQLKGVIVLFNPWCELADEHLPDEKARNEYILLESGYVYYGSWHSPACKGWNYAQFEPGTLAAVRRMMASLRASQRASPVLTARACSALCNAPDDNGVLVGNWTNDWTGGEPPGNWRGSLQILASWARTGVPVKYGQCWVFAALLTSVMRCIGLGARPVSNYRSAHDTNANRMIEEYFDIHGNKVDKSGDSIWNFHVWTEVYMARPDLPQQGLGGWQAIDATPQERSEGKFQCGPASVAAVKLGLQLPYDTDFLIAEVNADVRRYVWQDGQPPNLISVDTRDIGRMVLTKAMLSWDQRGENVVERYKAPEGSVLERASLLRLENSLALQFNQPGSLQLDIANANVGSTMTAKLTLRPNPGFAFPSQVTLAIRALASEYTGRGRSLLGNTNSLMTLNQATENGLTLNLPTTGYAFTQLLIGSFFPVLFVGIAYWKDGDNKDRMLVTEDSIELEVPRIELKSLAPPARVGHKSIATLSFKNPFSNRALTGVRVLAEGPHLLEPQTFPVQDVEAAGEAFVEVHFIPRARYAGSYMLIATLVSNEITGIVGQHVIKVSGALDGGYAL